MGTRAPGRRVAHGILIGLHCVLRGGEVLGLRFCDCMHFSDTVVLDLGFTKTGSRKGAREQVTITDSSLASLLRYFCRECESTERLVCMSPSNFWSFFRACFFSSIFAKNYSPSISFSKRKNPRLMKKVFFSDVLDRYHLCDII